MLQKRTVNPRLFGLLGRLMHLDELNGMRLVGGTALALQIGHRVSIDIDLFGKVECDINSILDKLKELGKVQILKQSKNINIFSIDEIKVDIVNYKYPWIGECKIVENIRMASLQDISAMKLNAIAGRGSKKDFIDLYYILKEYSLLNLFEFYNRKFDDGNLFLVKKSLTYYADADSNIMPKMVENVTWEDIKSELKQIVNQF